MESPAVCVACMAFWAWCVGGARGRFLSGLLAASLVAWKSSFLLFAPLPVLASLITPRPPIMGEKFPRIGG